MGGSFNPIKIVREAVKPFSQLLGGSGPIVQQAAPEAIAPAAAAQNAPLVSANQDTGEGISSESAVRKGKKSLSIKRTAGSGTGLNV